MPITFSEAVVMLNRGKNRIDKEDLIGALIDLNDSVKQNELEANSRINLGLVYYKQGLYEKAENELLEAIKINPDLPDSYYNLGVMFNNDGNKERAKKL